MIWNLDLVFKLTYTDFLNLIFDDFTRLLDLKFTIKLGRYLLRYGAIDIGPKKTRTKKVSDINS